LWSLPALAAAVSGTVQLANSIDPEVHKRKDYSGVVVWLEPVSPQSAAPEAAPARTAKMIQKDKRFVPHVLAIPVGTAVEFPNYDPIFHNAFSSFSGQVFDVGLYPPGTSRTVVFKRSGIVRVFCNIHPTMSAVIAVIEHPWFAVSQSSGAFQIKDIPPGEYNLRVYHERATEATLKALERRVAVTSKGLALPAIVISETGFAAAPHKNKYGQDYPSVMEDPTFYPGTRK
jgi:plastocyanin